MAKLRGKRLNSAAEYEDEEEPKTTSMVQKTIASMGQLNSTLPTGTALVMQFLLPIVTTNGECPAGAADRWVTGGVLAVCAIGCFALAFTDTYTVSGGGASYYGVATRRGLWLLAAPPADVAAAAATDARYALRASDWAHAVLSVGVFAAAALFDADVKACLYPSIPAHLQISLPPTIAFFASFLLLLFPSRRRTLDQAPPPPLPAAVS